MSDLTLILQQIQGGDRSTAERILSLVSDERRKLTAEIERLRRR